MHKPVVMIGMGEMGGVFARGFLRAGYPVYPVTRVMDLVEMANQVREPELVVVAVAENDLHAVLETIPSHWRHRLLLLQNELLPADWQRHGLNNPTVISVWFEKKKGQDVKVLISSPVYGPAAELVNAALTAIDVPCNNVDSEEALLFELVVKNVYILTVNIAGLITGGTVSELWRDHRQLAEAVAQDVIALQQALTGKSFKQDELIAAMLRAFDGDPKHKCMGRSAPARLVRALQLAQEKGIAVPELQKIAQQIQS